MGKTFAILTAAVISLLALESTIAAPTAPGVGDRLSLSITNKYGDVLANPAVAQILGDGLVLQRGAMEMKVKYAELPPDVRQKYQPLATGVIQQQEKEGAADAAYLAYTRQLQAQQAQHLAAQEEQENQQATERAGGRPSGPVPRVVISIPNQNWKLTIANLGFSGWQKQESANQIVLRGSPGPGGFTLTIFIETPVNNLPGNDPAYNFYWSNMAHSSLIDAQSVKVERRDSFVKVFYTAQGQPNANYFFAYQGRWVDLHLSKPSFEPGDKQRFADFDNTLSYSE